jgi:hypothetical protein
MLELGKIKPVIYQRFALEQEAQAHELMESSKHIGKIMLRVLRNRTQSFLPQFYCAFFRSFPGKFCQVV